MQFSKYLRTLEGHRTYATRKVAEKIDVQIRHQAELCDVDVRQDIPC